MTGVVYLTFTAVSHQMVSHRILLHGQASLTADAELVPNIHSTDIDSVLITGDFSDFGAPERMTPTANGTFTYTASWSKPTMRYQVQIFPKGMSAGKAQQLHTVNGTQFDAVEYDSGGDYRSIVKVKGGKVSITFDPKKLPMSKPQSGSISITSAADKVYADYMESTFSRLEKLIGLMRSAGRESERTAAAQDSVKQSVRAALAESVDAKNTLLSELRTMRVLIYAQMLRQYDSTLANSMCTLMKSMPAASPAWSADPDNIGIGLTACNGSMPGYLEKVIAENTSYDVRPNALYRAIDDANEAGDETTLRKYYNQLVTSYPKHWATDAAKKDYSPDKKIAVGKMLPNFSYASLDEPGVTFTPASFKGKYLLIDLWATWCGPCVMEMPNLHKAYERFKGPDFEILSISMDQDKDRIPQFRKRYAMPWKHSFSPGVWKSEVASFFEVSGIPKPILVDPNGKIIAITKGLRGEDLEKTLATYLKR
jgi:thiol-disulfide isomerase/thioredoxin